MNKLDPNSWHFKCLTDHQQGRIIRAGGVSLCKYFWLVVLNLLGYAVGTIALIAFGLLLAWCLYYIGYTWYFTIGYGLFDMTSFDTTVLVNSIVGNIVVLAAALVYYVIDNLIHLFRWYTGRIKPHKEPTLIGSYIRAKKDRVCPYMLIKGQEW